MCCQTREHTRFCSPEEEPCCIRAPFIEASRVQREDQPPGEDYAGLEGPGAHPLHDQIGGHFKDDVRDEVDGLDPVVCVGGHAQLSENVGGRADVQGFDGCGVFVVDLLDGACLLASSVCLSWGRPEGSK